MKTYCMKCGFGNIYEYSQPKVCGKCKESLDASSLPIKINKPTATSSPIENKTDLDPEFSNSEAPFIEQFMEAGDSINASWGDKSVKFKTLNPEFAAEKGEKKKTRRRRK